MSEQSPEYKTAYETHGNADLVYFGVSASIMTGLGLYYIDNIPRNDSLTDIYVTTFYVSLSFLFASACRKSSDGLGPMERPNNRPHDPPRRPRQTSTAEVL